MKCKSCGQESPATLCNICFLDEVISAVEMGEDNPSRILKGMVTKYGRLRNLKSLPSFRTIFGPQRLRRVITTESGERCRLVPTYDGWVAVTAGRELIYEELPGEFEEISSVTAEGSRQPAQPRLREYTGQSIEGGRIITYYEGGNLIKEIHTPTSLVIPRRKHIKRGHRASYGPPSLHYTSPLAHERPPSPLD